MIYGEWDTRHTIENGIHLMDLIGENASLLSFKTSRFPMIAMAETTASNIHTFASNSIPEGTGKAGGGGAGGGKPDPTDMFCFQCQETRNGVACMKSGVCGKIPEVANISDLLIYCVKGLCLIAFEGRKHGVFNDEVDVFAVKAIFSTLTNVDFDPARYAELIDKCISLREELRTEVKAAGGNVNFADGPAAFTPAESIEDKVAEGKALNVVKASTVNVDIRSLREIIIYGIKGLCSYADSARILG